jgi:hypothetical protein
MLTRGNAISLLRRWLTSQVWWMSPLALVFSAALGGGWWWQRQADARAEREEQRTIRDAVISKQAQIDVLTAQYIRLRDTADVHRDWPTRVAAIGMRTQILFLRDDRNRMERQLAAMEERLARPFHDTPLPPPLAGEIRLLMDGRDAQHIIAVPGGSTIQFTAQTDSGDVDR